jgi:hypothetical protein
MTHVGEDLDGAVDSAEAVGLEGGEVEDVDALGLTDELEALDTGGLLAADCQLTAPNSQPSTANPVDPDEPKRCAGQSSGVGRRARGAGV